MKAYYNLNFTYFAFYSFMKVSYSHISYYSCKIHAFSHIFFEHFYDFKTHIYVQIKIKFSKIAFLSKYCKFDIWSYFQLLFSKLRYINFFFFKTSSHSFSIFELNHIAFFFYERKEKRFHIKKRSLKWKKRKKKNFISLFCYSTLVHSNSNSLNIAWNVYHFKYRWL